MYSHTWDIVPPPVNMLAMAGPVPTAGLNAPPDTPPAAYEPTVTVKPMARP